MNWKGFGRKPLSPGLLSRHFVDGTVEPHIHENSQSGKRYSGQDSNQTPLECKY
jgi:hypothetical protein